jgi:hypothetical protein
MFVHDIGVVWHFCEGAGCPYKTKSRSDMKRHGNSHS